MANGLMERRVKKIKEERKTQKNAFVDDRGNYAIGNTVKKAVTQGVKKRNTENDQKPGKIKAELKKSYVSPGVDAKSLIGNSLRKAFRDAQNQRELERRSRRIK